MFNKIQELSILDVLDKLLVGYKRVGENYRILKEDGTLSNGWVVFIKTNSVVDFSKGTRAQGGPFSFVKHHLGINAKQTFDWFKANFPVSEQDALIEQFLNSNF